MIESEWLYALLHGASLILLFIVVFMIAKWLKDWFTPYNIEQELTTHDNPAIAVSMAGYYLAVCIVFIGAFLGPSEGIRMDLLIVGGYSLMGILLLNAARVINNKLILHKFCCEEMMIKNHNTGTGIILFSSYVSSGLIIAGSIHGEGGSVITALVFFLIGQLALIIFSKLYDWITPYSLHKEVENNNIAAGLGFGGALIAIGIIIMKAVSGAFIGWLENLELLGADIVIVFVYLIIVRLFFDKVVIAKSDLNQEIARDKNIGAGLLECFISVGFSAVLFFVL